MANPSDTIDQRTYQYEIFALDLYLKGISTGHALVRAVGSLATILLVFVGFGGQNALWLALWGFLLFSLELGSYFNVRNYFRRGAVKMDKDGSLNGRFFSTRYIRTFLYGLVLLPTTTITWLYVIPCFFLAGEPGAAPAIGVMVCILVMMNIASTHTYRLSLPFITTSIPAVALFSCLLSISAAQNQVYFLGFGALIVVQSVSIAIAGHKAQSSMLRSRQKAETEAQARQHADEANRAKSQFLANMSHELRTPLNAIIGYSEMMQEDAEMDARDADVDDHKRIILAGKRLLLHINDILDFSKIEAGKMDTEIAQFDLGEMINEAVDTIRPALAEKNVELTVDLPEELPAAWSDRHKLGQCILNLLSNSAKFTHDGRIDVVGYVEEIAGFSGFVIEVRDTGIGMTKEQLTRLFQPFTQADSTFTRKYGGTGLGLVITERLIGLLGGTISVTSSEGQGSVFKLHFPIMTQLQNQCDMSPNDDCHMVLVIDDDRDAFELIARDLHSIGLKTRHAVSAEEGRQVMAKKTPDLIILDMHLPGENGISFLKSIRAEKASADIPVIAHTVDSDRQASLDAGASLHLTKPTPRETLLAAVVRFALHNQVRSDSPDTQSPMRQSETRQTA